jgi:hypothetical protein
MPSTQMQNQWIASTSVHNADRAARADSKQTAVETQLTATRIIQPIHLFIRQRNPQTPPNSRDHSRVIPLFIIRLPVMQVLSLPERIIPGPKGPAVPVELVRKDQVPRFARLEGGVGVSGRRGVAVDELKVANVGDLAGRACGVSPLSRPQSLRDGMSDAAAAARSQNKSRPT